MINKNNVYTFFKGITPPFLFNWFKKSSAYNLTKKVATKILPSMYTPKLISISHGILKGRKIYASKGSAIEDMVQHNHDSFLIDFLQKQNIEGSTIFDIGAHIGISTLCFAKLVGPQGHVAAFEPNQYNKERLEENLKENPDLSAHVDIYNYAVSNTDGEIEFVYSANIEGGTSSGSFISEADTHLSKDIYEKEIGFIRQRVPGYTLDTLTTKIGRVPDVIKIDVEGAEFLVLEGGKNYFTHNHPILLIEIHSIFNMLKVSELLHSYQYTFSLLHKEADGRCFIAASKK
jgi:FkbM family methyltransferase